MATLTLAAVRACSKGDHIEIRLDVNGVERAKHIWHIDELREALRGTDALYLQRILLAIYAADKTPAQVKTALQAGISITV